MNIPISRFVAIPVLLLIVALSKSAFSETRWGDLEIEVCDFKVPHDITQANASFSVVFVVQVGDDGRPVKVDKIKNDFLADEPFVSCIKNWILPKGTQRLAVIFTWKHAEGWIEIAISGDGMNYQIKIQPGALSQYGGSQREPPGNRRQARISTK